MRFGPRYFSVHRRISLGVFACPLSCVEKFSLFEEIQSPRGCVESHHPCDTVGHRKYTLSIYTWHMNSRLVEKVRAACVRTSFVFVIVFITFSFLLSHFFGRVPDSRRYE